MAADEKPTPIEKKQDKKYMKLRRAGKEPLEAANEAVPPATTAKRSPTNQKD